MGRRMANMSRRVDVRRWKGVLILSRLKCNIGIVLYLARAEDTLFILRRSCGYVLRGRALDIHILFFLEDLY